MSEKQIEQCDNCKNELRIFRLEEAEKANREAHNKIYGRLEDSNVSYTKTDIHIQNIFKTLDDMARDIKALKEKDSKRWESVVTTVIVALVSGAVGYFFSRI